MQQLQQQQQLQRQQQLLLARPVVMQQYSEHPGFALRMPFVEIHSFAFRFEPQGSSSDIVSNTLFS